MKKFIVPTMLVLLLLAGGLVALFVHQLTSATDTHYPRTNPAGGSRLPRVYELIRLGDAETIQQMLSDDVDPNALLEDRTPLVHYTIWAEKTDTLQAFLTAGADPNLRDPITWDTPLHIAARKQKPAHVELLLSEGADPNLRNHRRETPLLIAVRLGVPEMVMTLLDANAEPNTADAVGKTPLHCAVAAGRKPLARLLLDAGAKPNVTDARGRTALHHAIDGDLGNVYPEIITMLLTDGAEVNVADAEGNTPLHLASRFGLKDIVQVLRNAKALVDPTNKLGQTPLFLAAAAGHPATVQTLLEEGASASTRDNAGRSPLSEALWNRNQQAAWALKDSVDESAADPLVTAIQKARTADAIKLIKKGQGVQKAGPAGRTPLHWAGRLYEADTLPIVRALLEAGVDTDARDNLGRTPLMVAAATTNSETIKLLIENDADLGLFDKSGRTALHHAAAEDREDNIRLLLTGGADPLANTNPGEQTPLLLCAGRSRFSGGVREMLGLPPAPASPDVKDALAAQRLLNTVAGDEEYRLALQWAESIKEPVADAPELETIPTVVYRALLTGDAETLKGLAAAGNKETDELLTAMVDYTQAVHVLREKVIATHGRKGWIRFLDLEGDDVDARAVSLITVRPREELGRGETVGMVRDSAEARTLILSGLGQDWLLPLRKRDGAWKIDAEMLLALSLRFSESYTKDLQAATEGIRSIYPAAGKKTVSPEQLRRKLPLHMGRL
ncbi:MAG: ankyrin repeat domain-containing protein [Phycisphaerae bacterium]